MVRWMSLEPLMQSEVSQEEKVKYGVKWGESCSIVSYSLRSMDCIVHGILHARLGNISLTHIYEI